MKGESFVEGITAILVKRKIIDAHEAGALKKSFRDSPKPNFDDFLLDEGLIDKENLLLALGDYYQIPPFDPIGYFFDHQLVRAFPKEFLRSNAIIPIEKDEEDMLIMLANNPADPDLLLRIGRFVSYDIQFRVGILQDIIDSIGEFYDQALTEIDEDEDLDKNRHAREHEIEQKKEIEELDREDFEQE